MLSFRRFAPVLAVSLAFLIPPGLAAGAAPGSADAGNTNAAPASHGYLPLHPDYPQVKAQADATAQAKAQGSGAAVKGGHGGGGGTGPSLTNPNLGWEGVFQTSVTPPDSTGAAGPSHYVELVNDQYGIYKGAGPPVLSGPLSTLFADTLISNGALSDPQILWDPATSRFYYVAIDTTSGNYALLYGFTKTSDPTAGFCSYRALSYGSTLPDYPKLGDMAGYLLVGVNDFANASTYTGSEVAWITKPATGNITNCPVAGTAGQIPLTVHATPVPAVQADTTSTPGYVVQAADVSGSSSTPKNQLFVTSITPPSSTTTQTTVGVGSYYLPPNAPQYGTSKRLDTLDGRFEHAVEVGGVVYTAHAVAEASGGRSVERWYAIDTGNSDRVTPGALGDSSLYVFNGAISPDLSVSNPNLSGGNLVLGVSTSGANAYPAMQAVKWQSGNPTPSLATAASPSSPGSVIEQSQTYNYDFSCSGLQSVCRWGDYSGASPDPLGGGVFLSNQYNVGGGSIFQAAWRTRNIRIATP
jgi:hypothetical protein